MPDPNYDEDEQLRLLLEQPERLASSLEDERDVTGVVVDPADRAVDSRDDEREVVADLVAGDDIAPTAEELAMHVVNETDLP